MPYNPHIKPLPPKPEPIPQRQPVPNPYNTSDDVKLQILAKTVKEQIEASLKTINYESLIGEGNIKIATSIKLNGIVYNLTDNTIILPDLATPGMVEVIIAQKVSEGKADGGEIL